MNLYWNKGTPRQVYHVGLMRCLPVAINSDGGQTMCSSEVSKQRSPHIHLGPILTRCVVELDMRGTTARSASAICFSESFAVDHTKRTEALFIAHSSTAQKATFIRVNNRSLKLHVFIIK